MTYQSISGLLCALVLIHIRRTSHSFECWDFRLALTYPKASIANLTLLLLLWFMLDMKLVPKHTDSGTWSQEKIVISCDVVFNETTFPMQNSTHEAVLDPSEYNLEDNDGHRAYLPLGVPVESPVNSPRSSVKNRNPQLRHRCPDPHALPVLLHATAMLCLTQRQGLDHMIRTTPLTHRKCWDQTKTSGGNPWR